MYIITVKYRVKVKIFYILVQEGKYAIRTNTSRFSNEGGCY